MLLIHTITFYLHIMMGAIALVAFWLPMAARKGSHFHRQAGTLFVRCMWAISISGIIMSAIVWLDPLAIRFPGQSFTEAKAALLSARIKQMSEFLFLLSVLVLVSVKQGTLVLKAKNQRSQLKHWSHIGWIYLLGIGGVYVLIKSFDGGYALYTIFGALSIFASVSTLRYIYKTELKQREWIIEHMSSIIGGGIGVYTAFFAFGGRQLLGEILTGNWIMLPWILPGVIGTVYISFYKKKYQRQFRVE